MKTLAEMTTKDKITEILKKHMAYDMDKESDFIQSWAEPIADEIFALLESETKPEITDADIEAWARMNPSLYNWEKQVAAIEGAKAYRVGEIKHIEP